VLPLSSRFKWLIPCSRAPLEKLTATQLLKIFSAFCGTRRFITVFTTAHHSTLSWVICIQSTTSHIISLRSVLILSSHLCVSLLSNLVPSGFSDQNLVCISHLSHACYMPRPSQLPWLDQNDNIWWHLEIMKLVCINSRLICAVNKHQEQWRSEDGKNAIRNCVNTLCTSVYSNGIVRFVYSEGREPELQKSSVVGWRGLVCSTGSHKNNIRCLFIVVSLLSFRFLPHMYLTLT